MKSKKKLYIYVLIWLIVAVTSIVIFIYNYFFRKVNEIQTMQQEVNIEQDNADIEDEKEEEDINIKMSVIGDIMCHNSQYKDAYNSNTGEYDFSYVFEDIKQYVDTADIAVGNLETTFAGKERGYSNYPRFNTPEKLAWDLKDLGIDVVSTANNHCMDTNYTGLVSTIKYLDEAGISHTGTNVSKEDQNKILVKDVNGIRIAFLSFTYGTNGIPIPTDKDFAVNLIDENFMLEQIELAKEQEPDLICASMHWGIEYEKKQNSEQERLVNLLFEHGVDIIFGSHPHVLQPMEKKTITLENGDIKDVFVIYSLGNFMSGQTKENTRDSIILNLDITKNGKTGKVSFDNVEYIPIYMYKSQTGKIHRYKILDIEKSIANYESGQDVSIGQATYRLLKNELNKIKSTFGTGYFRGIAPEMPGFFAFCEKLPRKYPVPKVTTRNAFNAFP